MDTGDGALSLREAVAQANATVGADTILFAGTLEGRVLQLTQGELTISRDLVIDGDSNNDGRAITLNGYSNPNYSDLGFRALSIVGGETDVTLNDLTIADGHTEYGNGGSIFLGGGGLTATRLTVRECSTGSYGYGGGAIYAQAGSRLELRDSALVDNGAGSSGGGAILAEEAATVIIRGSNISGNGTSNYGAGGGIAIEGSSLTIESSVLSNNHVDFGDAAGGAIAVDGSATIMNSSIIANTALAGGGIAVYGGSEVTLQTVTVADNYAAGYYYKARGGGIWAGGAGSRLTLNEATVTGNRATGGDALDDRPVDGGGLYVGSQVGLEISNSVVSGNLARNSIGQPILGPDIFGSITLSNGHNVFGSDVLGNNPGDRENVAPSALFATLDPDTGGGQVNSSGIVLLRNSTGNPALSGADPLAASSAGQLGGTARPLPAGSLPDIGSIEINQPLSTGATANNDVRSGTSAANTLAGLGGNDLLKGLGGNDTLNGGDGSDLLDGGPGNDRLNGDGAVDLVSYGGSAGVTVDLSLATDTARRGSETDTLTNVEGAVGSSAGDVFKGNQFNNYWQGGLGKDTFSGGSGRDLYDLNAVAESGPGSTARDIVTDFLAGTDDLDLTGIDADTGVAGNQAFRWVGTAALTGAGQVGYFASGGNTIVRASNDADAASELEVQLTGIKALTAADFYL